jgi:hypothetical protein
MGILKFLLIGFLNIAAPVPDGWFPVEKKQTEKQEEVWDESGGAIWPVFTKRFGEESIQVRFPGAPEYRVLSGTELEIFSSSGGEESLLRILNPQDLAVLDTHIENLPQEAVLIEVKRPESNILDLQYYSEGKWVAERLIVDESHLYLFQTSSKNPLGASHKKVISSLNIQK